MGKIPFVDVVECTSVVGVGDIPVVGLDSLLVVAAVAVVAAGMLGSSLLLVGQCSAPGNVLEGEETMDVVD